MARNSENVAAAIDAVNAIIAEQNVALKALKDTLSQKAAGGTGDTTQIDGIIDRSITEISNDRVTVIGAYAFRECRSLNTIDFPAATIVSSHAFYGCISLATVDFPAVTNIGNNAFRNCTGLITVSFPAANTTLGSNVFDSCTSLTTVYFPALSNTGGYSFANCKSLSTAEFPVTNSIAAGTFYDCTSLNTLILRKTDKICALYNTNAFTSTPIESGTGYIYVPSTLVDSYKAATNWSVFADQIRAIEDYPEITGGAA